MDYRQALQDKLDQLQALCLEQEDIGPLLKEIRRIEHLMQQLDSEEGALSADLLDVLKG